MYSNIDEIKTKHRGNIYTLWKIYTAEKEFYKNFYFRISFVVSLVLLLLSYFSEISSYHLIIKVADVALNILPNLLGFNLGAYILVVGFGGTNILNTITKPLEKQSNYSFYQILNGVLAVSVILQIIALFISFIIIFWDGIQKDFIILIEDICIINTINSIGLFVELFLIIYSIIQLISVVKHVFMFAQTIHFCIYIEKLKTPTNTNMPDSNDCPNIEDLQQQNSKVTSTQKKKHHKRKK